MQPQNPADLEVSDQELIGLVASLSGHFILSEAHRLLYVDVPKVASSTIKWWFAGILGVAEKVRSETGVLRLDRDQTIHPLLRKLAPGAASADPRTILRALGDPSYLCFGFVRNPYRRLFSAWQNKVLLGEPYLRAMYGNAAFLGSEPRDAAGIAGAFENFLEHLATHEAPSFRDVHWYPQHCFVRTDRFPNLMIGKIESPGDLPLKVAARVSPEAPPLLGERMANSSLIPYERRFVTDRASELILALHAADFRFFGYSPNPPIEDRCIGDEALAKALQAAGMIRSLYARHAEVVAHLRLQSDDRIRQSAARPESSKVAPSASETTRKP